MSENLQALHRSQTLGARWGRRGEQADTAKGWLMKELRSQAASSGLTQQGIGFEVNSANKGFISCERK